jgi:hypothetical protein
MFVLVCSGDAQFQNGGGVSLLLPNTVIEVQSRRPPWRQKDGYTSMGIAPFDD